MIVRIKRKYYSEEKKPNKPKLADFVDLEKKDDASDYLSILDGDDSDWRRAKEAEEMRFRRDKNIFKKHLFELNKDLEDAERDSIEETRKEGKWTGGIGGGIAGGVIGAGAGALLGSLSHNPNMMAAGLGVGGLGGLGLGAWGGSKLGARINEDNMKDLIGRVKKNQKIREEEEKRNGWTAEDIIKIKKKLGIK